LLRGYGAALLRRARVDELDLSGEPEVVDELIIHGDPASCRAQIRPYADAGVTTLALWQMSFGVDGRQAARDLAPAAG